MKFLLVLIVCVAMMFVGCASPKNINGKVVKPQGIFTIDDKDPNIHYQVSMGNVIWSIVGIETVIIPVWLIGWQLWEPGYAKQANTDQCQ
jgi:hypothetical protein